MTHRIVEVFVSAAVLVNFLARFLIFLITDYSIFHINAKLVKIVHRSPIGFLPGHRTLGHIFTLKL